LKVGLWQAGWLVGIFPGDQSTPMQVIPETKSAPWFSEIKPLTGVSLDVFG
jgi:hypothetical protein